MDQARQWNRFIKLLVKHKILNLILFLISFTVGVMGTGIGGGGATVKREGGCWRGCYFKCIHHSKLVKIEAPGFGQCSGTGVGVTDKVTARCLGGRDDVRPLSWIPIFCCFESAAFERHLPRLINCPSKWGCLTPGPINNHSQHMIEKCACKAARWTINYEKYDGEVVEET